MEQNKTGKYIKYAIGEIVLVMIGILLALQVNNWNISRIEQKEQKLYLERLIKDLNFNLKEVEQVVNINQSKLYRINIVLERLHNDKISRDIYDFNDRVIELEVDTTRILNQTFGPNLLGIRFYWTFDHSDATYQELLANGKIDLIQNIQLKTEIIDYYSGMEDRLQLVNMAEMMRNDYVRTLADVGISMFNKMSFEEFDEYVQDKRKIIAEIENIYMMTSIHQNNLKYSDNSIEKKTRELIAKIEEFLK